MPAQETVLTYTMSAAGVAAIQSFIDAATAANSDNPDYVALTLDDYFHDFVAAQEQAWISTARSQVQASAAAAFNSMPVQNQQAVLGQMGLTPDPALLISTI